ncbi:2-oxoglutarate dehydrogenase E1 component [Polymorphobacter fuscus]|uniref:2-oxoglutarate dehydrogenase E1 component n=1 Tax=Sandarakinorhabdus fusca TaxID=1439888 RepID=A0A7C9GT09_9SPHN|nr:2-oxoglutarate dehydrogenase E1 component [Polymorphobacter fuscus]KAB7648356.1 2-oxoglutarate dehydrogenase E1 component [Polymorphobacter fuscus]MQT15869.1 2-oxoglutarate dehydrogenase E1 component [Polymorphobacter fuscus]NJC07858.1 2-oxoglutarate dehydrogenase E1 component [Polymorphobacter fuscus]
MDYEAGLPTAEDSAGPSWARNDWPLPASDDLTRALDARDILITAPAKAAAKAAAAGASPEAIAQAAQDSISALMLIRTYRVRGHLAANLDPLGLMVRDLPADLTPEYHGFFEADLDRPVHIGGALGLQTATIRELVEILRANYCGNVGVEYMHINDVEERRFIQDKIEGRDKEIHFTSNGKKAILNKLVEAEYFERFLGRKYVGTKRFGLDGAESMIPAMESIIKIGGQLGITEIVFGMPHRGRLNMLGNVMRKPFRVIFHEFGGGSANPDDVDGSGDVKYHLGTSTDREFDGNSVHLSLAPNPSHLEAVDPVVLGKVRAIQTRTGDVHHVKSLPVLLHGDAAFAGQGIVAECFGFSGVTGYNTGGTIHFVVNNQVGFTTSPQFARSSPYPSDVGKIVQAPIFHVNGDDPEAVTFATKVATEFRQKFGRDVVIDMWCYRRFGHNESDEPSFTQPLMYAEIGKHPAVSEIYAARLVREGVVDEGFLQGAIDQYTATLEADFEAATSFKANKADWFEGQWSGLGKPREDIGSRRAAVTGVAGDELRGIGRTLTAVPDGFAIHRTLARILDAKDDALTQGQNIDWATAEALAFGSLLKDGYGVRLSGQDSGRGTFSQRHSVWTDQKDGHRYVPLASISPKFEVYDSPLSEFGVLGFEYGFASADPKTLVLWEAQFGDFVNGAQTIIDQFIASGEIKWLRANGLTMLLPHGYEGQGPEHSSARMERFLQLCAEDNMQVANATTPANYFHLLRRQMLRDFRKPLIVFTPKSLLRHKRATSALEDMAAGTSFHRCLDDMAPCDPDKIRRLVLCSGKVYYDLLEAREKTERDDVYLLRVEQLYPFPGEVIAEYAARFPGLEDVVWAQEEPRNAGAWTFVAPLIETALDRRPIYAGRAAAAATATGLLRRHNAEQAKLIAEALGAARSDVKAAIGGGIKSSQNAG